MPYRNGSTSGFKPHENGASFASLYVDRSTSTKNATAPSFGYAKTLLLLPTEASLRLHVFLDQTILEAFANDGKAVVTARVYPTSPRATNISAYNNAPEPATLATFEAVELGTARLAAPPV